ncbi:MAG: hypothetical protein JNN13_01375 [Planctomycetes bacterium]|nr:hypothetical protein [Planctomycetota bacterium]
MLGVARWFFTFLGGVLLGGGLVLHGQVAVARHMQSQVDDTFFLWRAVGRATFAFQSGDVKMALAMKEVPPEALRESDRAAWVLVIVGGLIALTGPLLRHHQGKTGGKAAKGR